MFSHLSRGYGTWQGIAKLEKQESAISSGIRREDFVLPPIYPEKQYQFEQIKYDCPHKAQDSIKLPKVTQHDSLSIPKTYTTKSGALLLYSEGYFVPGSRRLKKRPRLRKRKEKRLQTLRDLSNLIMDYKKNECDPLLLAHLWRKANNSARDLRPGFSPKRYLAHLRYTTLDAESLRKLVETGSLKNLEAMEDESFLPLLVDDRKVADKLLRQRPQPYTTMSLPPVSPSSSMLGSFTFYQHGMSTGAASMVSMNSMNSDSLDDLVSAKTAGTYVESLAERLAEVESESGFKRTYESLSPKEKEELLTQLLMDVTLHNAMDFALETDENAPKSPTLPETTFSSLDETLKSIRSVDSAGTLKSVGKADSSKSLKSFKSLKSDSKSSIFSSVCSLPPIESTRATQDTEPTAPINPRASLAEEEQFERESSSGSGLTLNQDDLAVGLDGIDIEIADDLFGLGEDEIAVLTRRDTDQTISEAASSEYSLVEALKILEGEPVHVINDEVRSLKSVQDLDLGCNIVEEEDQSVTGGLVAVSVGDGHGGVLEGDGGVQDGDVGVQAGDVGVGDDGRDGVISTVTSTVGDGNVGDRDAERRGDGSSGDDDGDGDIVGNHGEQTTSQSDMPANEGLNVPHISLSSLHNEVKMVAEEVLCRPRSGRFLADDAQAATALLIDRIEGLLGPPVTDNIRVTSARPRKLRPLGEPRNSEVNKKLPVSTKSERTVKSAGPTLASRSYADLTNVENRSTKQIQEPEKENSVKGPVPAEEECVSRKVEDTDLKENVQEEIDLDDIIVTTNDTKDPGKQSLEVKSETPPPEIDFLTVKDLKSTEQTAEKEEQKDMSVVKNKKDSIKKPAKGKKGVNAKNVPAAKGKRKKKSNARSQAQNEPPKTPPFRAGLAPEPKPPKGLDVKSDDAPKQNDKMSKDATLVDQVEDSRIEEPVEPKEVTSDLKTVKPETRINSETGEVEPFDRKATPFTAEKMPSPREVISSVEHTPSPDERTMSSRKSTPSLRDKTTPREKTPSPSETMPPSREKTPSPREKTLSPHDKTPSPRDKTCPEGGVAGDNGSPERQPSPVEQEVVSERVARANARAAQRAAAAERRRQEVERKRREREEARRRAQEEEARLEQLRREAEEEMKKREEERRIQKEREDQERRCQEAEERERARQERLMMEREKAAREDWERRKEQLMAQRRLEEEMRKERERIEQQIEEERRREYEAHIAHLEDEERERLMEERRLEEERIKREIEEERLKREEERRRVLEERRKMEEELEALRERQFARQLFLEMLWKEYQELIFDQKVSRAFTFSYFDLFPWLKERWSDVDERPASSGVQTARDGEETEVEQTIPEMSP